jgi:hypothetical protein
MGACRRYSRRQSLAQLWPRRGYWRGCDQPVRRREAFQRGPTRGASGGVIAHRLRHSRLQRVMIVRFEQRPECSASAWLAFSRSFGSVASIPVHNISSVPLRNDYTVYTRRAVSM